MSFLRNARKALIAWQSNAGNGRALSLSHSRKQIEKHDYKQGLQVVEADPIHRTDVIDVETSIRYVNSDAFKKTYHGQLIWTLYRRNKTRHFESETRKKCIRNNIVSTASPCPICRDQYLVLDHRNVKLLQQFISPHNGMILPSIKTGLCQMQQDRLIVAILRAKEYGTLSYYIPFRHYDYSYYKELSERFLEESRVSKE